MAAADQLHQLCDLVIQGWDEARVPEQARMQMVQQLQEEISKGAASPQGGGAPPQGGPPPPQAPPQAPPPGGMRMA